MTESEIRMIGGDEATPEGMLRLFRVQSHEWLNHQAEAFNKMSVYDRLELLFYMAHHTNRIVGHVHRIVEPDVETGMSMPDVVGN